MFSSSFSCGRDLCLVNGAGVGEEAWRFLVCPPEGVAFTVEVGMAFEEVEVGVALGDEVGVAFAEVGVVLDIVGVAEEGNALTGLGGALFDLVRAERDL